MYYCTNINMVFYDDGDSCDCGCGLDCGQNWVMIMFRVMVIVTMIIIKRIVEKVFTTAAAFNVYYWTKHNSEL